jgi:hypothetical protein
MKARRIIAVVVGVIQCIVAASVFIFACSLYFNLFGAQAWLDAVVESCDFHVLVLLVFGFFSLMSGLFLVYEASDLR